MNRVYITGDLHREVKYIEDFIHFKYDTYGFDRSDTMILLGDSGLNYFLDERDTTLKAQLATCPMTFFVIRGNHEERAEKLAKKYPDEWHKEVYFDNFVWVENVFPNIKYAMDFPTSYEIKGMKTLVYPGAYSIDKEYRLMRGWKWFKEEQLTESEKKTGLFMAGSYKDSTDLILSHTAPREFEPKDLFLDFVDQSKVDKTMEDYLQIIHENVNYKLWCWGHYHADRLYPPYEGGKKQAMFFHVIRDLEEFMKNLEKIK